MPPRSRPGGPGRNSGSRVPSGARRLSSRPVAPRGNSAGRSTSRAAAPPPPRKVGRAHWTGRAAILVLVMLVLAVSYASSMKVWLSQRSQSADLTAQIALRQHQIADLRLQKVRWKDPAYVKEQARVRFGWIMPGQVGYRVIGSDGKVLQTSSSLASPVASTHRTPDWWQTAWSSVVGAADLPPKPGTIEHPAKRIDQSGKPSR